MTNRLIQPHQVDLKVLRTVINKLKRGRGWRHFLFLIHLISVEVYTTYEEVEVELHGIYQDVSKGLFIDEERVNIVAYNLASLDELKLEFIFGVAFTKYWSFSEPRSYPDPESE